jgi:hypothetical protein
MDGEKEPVVSKQNKFEHAKQKEIAISSHSRDLCL